MARSSTYLNINGVDIGIEYNPVNLRFTVVNWTITDAITIRARIFQDGVQIYERVIVGPDSGSENVPGNRRLTEVTDPDDGHTYLAWPEGLTAEVGPI